MDGMGGAAAADHAGHNHTAHDHASHDGGMEGMDMSKYMGSVERLPNGGYHYPHGAFLGHVVPGAFFLVRLPWSARNPAPRAHPAVLLVLPSERAAGRTSLFLADARQQRCVSPGCFIFQVALSKCQSRLGALAAPPPPPCPTSPAPPLPQVWGFWWTVATFATYVQCLAARRGFQTRAWRLLPWGPPRLRSLPLEPVIKILLPACGILC